ncbi:MAG TPA: amino acid adenylation domain-containing protein [Thermoanaerobaculia bacterium]|nr:amino acid adenylation domain-containing protein [Thermoanaerobaculia bacterium]
MAVSMMQEIEGFRLSPQQRRLWTLWRESPAYRAQCALHVKGALSETLLRRAIQDAVDRHEALRTTFRRSRGIKMPLQVVEEEGSATWRQVDLGGLPAADRETVLQGLLREELEADFDLEAGPVLRVALASFGDGESCLVLTLPALTADARSLANLAGEISAAYAARLDGGSLDGADELVQHAQFSEWQNGMLEEDEGAADGQDYWRKVAQALPEPLRLPSQETSGNGAPYAPRMVPVVIDGRVAADLAVRARELDAEPSLLLLAAWQALLARTSGRADLALAATLDNRGHEDLQGVLGPLAKTVPVRCRVDVEESFADLVRRTRESLLDASDWLEFFAPDEESGAGADIGFEAHTWSAPGSDGGLRLSLLDLAHCGEKTRLLLSCVETDGRWLASLRFDPRELPLGEAERLAERFGALLASALEQPRVPIERLPLLGPGELRLLLGDLNDTAAPYPSKSCLHELFEEQASREPGREALRFGDRRLTYAELDESANRLARFLRSFGVGSDDRVAVCVERSPEMVAALLAILKAGAAYVAVDPSYPRERMGVILEDSQPRVVLTEARLAEALPATAAPRVLLDADAPQIAAFPATRPGAAAGPDNLAYVLYTSGSTGRPKGVMVPHRGLANYLSWAIETYGAAKGGAPLHSPIGFDLTVTSLFAPLLAGGRVDLLLEEQGIEALGTALRTGDGFSLVKVTPAHLEILRQSLQRDGLEGRARVLVLGGEALFHESLALWREHAPGTRLINEYGPTETVVGCCVYEVPAGAASSGPVPIGRPIANTRLYVLDRHLEPVPFGAVGELYVGGAGVTRGYLGRPDLTAERYVADPFGPEPGGRLYRTGDLVRYLAGGDLEVLGRNDHQVKIRGFRIELGEVESALLSHPGVSEAVVVAREAAEGAQELVAYVTSRGETGTADLRAHVSAILPGYMVPAHFVELAEMPLTRHGKVDRQRLPEPSTAGARMDRVPPRNPLEGKLVALWEEVLQREDVGVTDNFFDLGGDSIKAVRLISRVNDEVPGANVQMQDIFKHQTIEALAPSIGAATARPSIREEREAGLARIEALRQRVLSDEKLRAKLPQEIEDVLPLSGIESGMLYYSLLMPEQPVYHDQFVYRMSIDDPDRFFKAFDLLTRKHRIYRSVFYFYSFDEPIKVMVPRVPVAREVEDLSGLPWAEQIRCIEEYRAADLAQKFDLDGHVLWRLKLFCLQDDLYCAVWSWHHAILDGWSNLSFWVEMNALYARPDLDELQELPALASSYRDYVGISLARISSPVTESFWRQTLDGVGRNKLPFNRVKPRDPHAYGMDSRELQMDRELLARVRAVSLRHHVSLQSFFLSAHVELLRVLTGERDVVTGVVSHDRPGIQDGDRMLGCFLNTVPVRVNMAGTPTGLDLVQAVSRYLSTVKEHEIPLINIAALTGIAGEGDNPIFDTIFNFMDFHVVAGVQDNVLFKPLESEEVNASLQFRANEMTNTLFDVEVSTTRGNLFVRIKFSPRYFEASEIERALALYQRIIGRFAEDLDVRLGTEALLTPAELDQIVVRFNDTAADYPRHLPMHRLFEERAAASPGAPAVVCAGRSLTYGEVDRRANRLARRLRSLGAGRGASVGVVFERSVDLVVVLMAVLKTGAAYVPLEPDYPAARKGYIVAKSKARLVLSDRACDIQVPPGAAMPELVVVTPGELTVGDAERPELTLDPDDLAYTIYTSGSTGNPKGVMIEHHSAVNLIQWVNREHAVGPETRILMLSSVCFDLSVWDLFGGLGAGATVVIARPGDLQDPARLMQLAADERITFWSSVPSTLGLLVKYLEDVAPDYRQDDLRVIFLSGDWIPVSLPSRARRFFPNARIISLGGATEATVWSISFPVDEVDPSWVSIPYGRPIDNNAFYILDGHLDVVPPGVVGELYIGGSGVAIGYANDPEKTADQFMPDRFSGVPGQRMYRTGDLGRMRPDGNIEFLGRADHQVKIRGFRVELGEIESQLSHHPAIREAVVVDKVDRLGEKYLCAYFVSPADLQAAELKSFLAASLPDYMIPATFVRLETLPLTANGKLDRKRLPEPDVQNLSTGAEYVAPVDEVEAALVEIVEEVLGVKGIGTRHDFFEVGGHSLSVVQMVTRIRRRFEVELPLRDFFNEPTVQGLARIVHRLRDAGMAEPQTASGIVPGRRPEKPLASFNQQRLWFLQQLDPASPAFNMPHALRLKGRLDAGVLARALGELEARHEALRTAFQEVDGAPVQVVGPAREHVLPHVDLSGLPQPLRAAELDRLGDEEAHSPFDLERGPLWRTRLLRLEGHEHVLLFNVHHIVSDGWSIGIIVRELGALYPALLQGEPSPLPSLPVQFADYAHWERETTQGEALEEHLAYWRRQLAGAQTDLTLPGQRPRPAVPRFEGEARGFTVPLPIAERLRELSQREEATLFVTLLAAFNAFLHLYTGQEDVVVGTNFANRNEPELERLVGFFVNNLALRTDLSADPSFRELVRRVRETALDAYTHQAVPFEKVIEEVQPRRSAGYSPLFRVMLTFENFPVPPLQLSDLSVEPVGVESRRANFDLNLLMAESDQGILASFVYDTDLFDTETIATFIEGFQLLLRRIAEDPDLALSDLSLVATDENEAMVSAFNVEL